MKLNALWQYSNGNLGGEATVEYINSLTKADTDSPSWKTGLNDAKEFEIVYSDSLSYDWTNPNYTHPGIILTTDGSLNVFKSMGAKDYGTLLVGDISTNT